MAVHDKIRALRLQNNWTQEQAAEKMDMSKNGYANMERGQASININRLEKAAEVFQVDILELLNSSKDVVLFVNENFENTEQCGNYYRQSDNAEKLNLQLAHQQTLLEQKDQEIAALKEIIALLKQQLEKSQ